MPTIQTNYTATHAVAYEGMVANSEPSVIVSRIAEDVEGIGFGKVCVRGDWDNTVTDAEASKAFEGIAIADPTQPADTFAQYATIPVMKKGVIWVMASVAVTKGQADLVEMPLVHLTDDELTLPREGKNFAE